MGDERSKGGAKESRKMGSFGAMAVHLDICTTAFSLPSAVQGRSTKPIKLIKSINRTEPNRIDFCGFFEDCGSVRLFYL